VSAYGQFCPASKATELLEKRWTMPVVRAVSRRLGRFPPAAVPRPAATAS
jgi:DNA-binding HxlR family transcriptional regulator